MAAGKEETTVRSAKKHFVNLSIFAAPVRRENRTEVQRPETVRKPCSESEDRKEKSS
jgi:hypothetical protein